MLSLQTQTLIFCILIGVVVSAEERAVQVAVEGESGNPNGATTPHYSQLSSEEFKVWLDEQERKVVDKIMEKITSPNDTEMQYEAKIAVARYLVNVTFTAMTRRLENSKGGKKQSFLTDSSVGLPMSPAVAVPTTELSPVQNETRSTTPEEKSSEEVLVFKGDGQRGNGSISSLPSSSSSGATASPTQAFPASSDLEGMSTTASPLNETEESTTRRLIGRPIWEEVLNFNFSAALRGEGQGGSLLNRLMGNGGGGGEGGGGFLSRLNLTGFGGGNGRPSLFDRLNLSSLGGGNGGNGEPNLFERLNLTALGGGGAEGGMGGGIFSRFNLSALRGPGAEANGTNMTGTGLPFNLPPPPEGLFNIPTPPPKNDSVRMSQIYLGSQVEKLMSDIQATNLTGVVESSLNIATPNTVGVLVNALLNLVLCNPLDRFNGNCGIE